MSDDLVEVQKAYYRARAGEYDEWWERRGLHDRGEDFLRRWDADKAELAAWLREVGARGDVLELAAGTGNFTRELVRTATSVTAVDSSTETLAIASDKVAAVPEPKASLEVVVDDLFSWQPVRRYDVVFFSFWLSHVPADRFAGFWGLVGECLAPGGQVLFIDNAIGGVADRNQQRSDGLSDRTLNDGSTFTIVKRFWEPAALVGELGALGWSAVVGSTSEFFVHGTVVRAEGG